MNLLSVAKFALVARLLTIAASQVMACSCGGAHGRNPWEKAEWEARSSVIFEGTLERVDARWPVFNAKAGELIPVDIFDPSDNNGPRMLVTFRVLRAYKGNLGPKIQLTTGLGGGDCGAHYSTGVKYLVYAYQSHGELSVSICSPGGWIGSKSLEPELRYLRKEPPTQATWGSKR